MRDYSADSWRRLVRGIVVTTRQQRHNPTWFGPMTLCRKCRVMWPCPIKQARDEFPTEALTSGYNDTPSGAL